MDRFTEDYCKAVAMSCETTSEFRKKYHAVAMKAQKMGWYESYTWLRMDRVPRNYWTYKTCKAEASKYKTLKEFRVKSPSAYVIANKKGWLKSFGLVRERGEKQYWTEDTCRMEALKYKTISDFRYGCVSAYNMAAHKGWLKSFGLVRERGKKQYWTEDTCRTEALKYKTLEEFRVKSPSAYVIANKKGWASSFTFLEHHNPMENKTGILFITSDRMFGTKDGAPYTESKCVTIDKCLESLCAYMQKVADYRPNGLWTYENGMLVTPSDACKMTRCKYESYDWLVCHNMVTYRFIYRTATDGLLSVVTMIFNDFYRV